MAKIIPKYGYILKMTTGKNEKTTMNNEWVRDAATEGETTKWRISVFEDWSDRRSQTGIIEMSTWAQAGNIFTEAVNRIFAVNTEKALLC